MLGLIRMILIFDSAGGRDSDEGNSAYCDNKKNGKLFLLN